MEEKSVNHDRYQISFTTIHPGEINITKTRRRSLQN